LDENITVTAQMLMEAKKISEQRSGEEIERMVVIKLPPARRDMDKSLVLLDLVKMGFLHDTSDGWYMDKGHLIVRRESTDDCKRMISYLNKKLGPVASLGRVKPLKKQTRKEIFNRRFSTKGHLAIVQDPEGEYPNQQYAAYERLDVDPETNMPRYKRVNSEAKLRFARHTGGAAAKYREKGFKYLDAKNNGVATTKNKFGYVQNNPIKTDIYETEDLERAHIEAQVAIAGEGLFKGVVDGREAISLQYTDKARKFRRIMETRGKGKVSAGMMLSFKREQTRSLIKSKAKEWNKTRRNKWYSRQNEGRIKIVEWKQEIDPTVLAKPDSIWVKAQGV